MCVSFASENEPGKGASSRDLERLPDAAGDSPPRVTMPLSVPNHLPIEPTVESWPPV